MQQAQTVSLKIQTPRGLIYDTNVVLLAGNNAVYNVMFTRNQSMTPTDLVTMAKQLGNYAVPGILTDKNINYVGGGSFHSDVNTIGTINTQQALEFSSNVYMGTIAARMAGFNIKDQGANYLMQTNNGPQFVHGFEALRNSFNEFGLGVETGVDLPYEATGYQGPIPIDQPGKIMQFAIGQYDTYTPLELAQYVSTIANGGYRIAPHFLKSINYPESQPNQVGPTMDQAQTKILDKVPNPPSQFQIVHQGFYLVTHGGPGATASMIGALWPQYDIAAKTGTAQVGTNFQTVNNKTLAGFAPYNNPQVAVVVVVPHIEAEPTNLWIGGDIFQAYFQDQKGN